MSDDAAGALCGCCCIFIATSFGSWCTLMPFGSGGCCRTNSNSGCCGSCCGDSFNEDSFDEQVKKDMARTRAPDAEIVASQPKAGTDMTMPENAVVAPEK